MLLEGEIANRRVLSSRNGYLLQGSVLKHINKSNHYMTQLCPMQTWGNSNSNCNSNSNDYIVQCNSNSNSNSESHIESNSNSNSNSY